MRIAQNDVEKLYKYCVDNNVKMLSDYDADFWEVYRENHTYFDRLFYRSYKSFLIFSLANVDSEEELADEWVFDIRAFLLANNKRYSELWRLQTIDDVDYSILDNYNVRESHNIVTEGSAEDVFGAKTDTKASTLSYGQIDKSEDNSYVHGARTENDLEDIAYGQDIKDTTTDLTVGAQNNSSENKVSADNVSTYSPKDLTTDNLGSRLDNTDTHEVRASREDERTLTHTEGTYTNTEAKSGTIESHTDSISDTNVYGAHTNSHSNDEEVDKTITRKGNIGVYSASRLLDEHRELWTAFNFYKMIFDEIADEFLRISYF